MKREKMRLGLLVCDLDAEYTRDLEKGILEVCQKENIDCFIFPARERNWPYGNCGYQNFAIAKHINKNNLDAIIVASGTQNHYQTEEEFSSFIASFKNMVVISIGLELPNILSVVADDKDALRQLIETMILVHNRKKILFIGGYVTSVDTQIRYNVYKSVLKKHKIEFNEKRVFYTDFSYIETERLFKRVYPEKKDIDFDAIVCANDNIACACVDYLISLGVNIPDEVVISGFDNSLRSRHTLPSLTTVNPCLEQQGIIAANLAIEASRNEKVKTLNLIKASVEYRESCPGREELLKKMTYDSVNEWYKRKTELSKLQFYLEVLQTDLLLNQLIHRTRWDLEMFEIFACSICLFEKPLLLNIQDDFVLPNKVQLLLSYDTKTNMHIEEPDIYFNPQDSIVPDEYVSENFNEMIVASLYHNEYQYGYMIYKAGSFDNLIYEMITSAFANTLASTISYTNKDKEAKTLEIKNETLLEYNQNLNIISCTDELTGIANRRGFMMLGQQAIDEAVKNHSKGVVVFGDMDGLKNINDTFGHEVGDRAIKAEADLLKKAFRMTDTIGRLGGDEFCVVAIGMTLNSFENTRIRMENLCKQYNEKSGEKFILSISLGAAEISTDNMKLDELLIKADENQYKEKNRKKNLQKSIYS